MTNKELLEIIEKAEREGATALDLSNKELTTLPPEIGKLTNLTALYLYKNKLTTLPGEIGELINLTKIHLYNNQLITLPPEIWELTNLTELYLWGNQLTTLPPEIGKLTNLTGLLLHANQLSTFPPEIWRLTNLTELSLVSNQLTALPPEIGNLTNLTKLWFPNSQLTNLPPEIVKLTNLTELNLSGNQLTTLPPEIWELDKLTRLVLASNQLTTLPQEIGKLTELTKLWLYKNQLTTLPPELWKLTNLTILWLNDNQLTTLPPEIGELTNLTILRLNNNQLTTLPPEIGKMTNLTRLDLDNNQLTTLPWEILKLKNLESLSLDDSLIAYRNTMQIIEKAERDGVTALNLSGMGLTILPPEIGKLTNLTELYLYNNQLTAIPEEIGKLTNLTGLDIGGNQLTILPMAIRKLTKLTKINLGYNQLTELPQEIKELTELTKLSLYRNRLTTLPEQIGELTKLKILDAHSNKLTGLPDKIVKLANLEELHLNDNKLATLPGEIGKLNNLTKFDLWKNELTALPPEIGKLTNLTVLRLDINQLTVLPHEIGELINLAVLWLNRNQLTTLSPEIGKLENLKELYLWGNPLPIPPEILSKYEEPSVIINYYLKLIEGEKKPLNEAKMILVGQGGVGKTSLVKRLIDDTFDQQEAKTEGIDVRQWPITVNDTKIRLNVWDFGGQEIMHATHQFFLTKRSLYVLVLDSRQGEYESKVEYWLKIIQSFAGDSPIIVVCNKCEQHKIDLNWSGLQKKYPTIKAFVKEVSCMTGGGILEVKELIEREVAKLDHLNDELLTSWFNIKDKLEDMRKTLKADYIPYAEYREMCRAEGITEDIDQGTLIRLLHDLGIVLNFQGDHRLEDTNILNPEWVTDGVYKILNSNELFQSKGVLQMSQLNHILDPQDYPPNRHMFVIDMMRKFELCFGFEGYKDKKFLVPDLLQKEEPDTGNWDNSLQFQYHYDVLPGSIISRFIVRMHAYISKNTYWRTGVVLKKDDNEALVRADIEDKKIFISIRGKDKTRCVFLEIIRSYLEGIHSTISGIEVKGKVPMPDNPDIVVDYEHLLLLEESGEKTYIPEGAIKRYSIKELLDGIESEKEQKPHISRSKIESGDYDVFLCYNYQDKQEVSEIGERLKKRGILPWLGEWELQPGMQFQEVIEKQSKHVKSVVIFVGAGGIGPWQKQEYSALIREMIERQRPVIPVFLHNCPNNVQFPLFLRMFLSVDFRKSETSPFESLVSGITEGREHVE